MLKVRVIPTLLWKNLGLVKGVAFDSWRLIGTLMPAVKVYNTRDVDELVLLDIAATREDREPDFETIEEIAAECTVPFTAGGGVKSLSCIRSLLRAGADKVVLNSEAYDSPELVSEAAGRFGSQCIVASIDFKSRPDGSYECVSHSGTRPRNVDPVAWAHELEARGAGEILLTSVERDGTMGGYDLELTRAVADRVNIPLIASGGAGSYQHLAEAIQDGGATAVAAASMFHFTEQTPNDAKHFMRSRGIPVRNMNVVG